MAKTVKTCGLMDLKVGQLGRVVGGERNDHLIYRRTEDCPPYGYWRFTDLTNGDHWDELPYGESCSVEPYPVGSKLIPRDGGRFAVELPAAPVAKQAMEVAGDVTRLGDLKFGDFAEVVKCYRHYGGGEVVCHAGRINGAETILDFEKGNNRYNLGDYLNMPVRLIGKGERLEVTEEGLRVVRPAPVAKPLNFADLAVGDVVEARGGFGDGLLNGVVGIKRKVYELERILVISPDRDDLDLWYSGAELGNVTFRRLTLDEITALFSTTTGNVTE